MASPLRAGSNLRKWVLAMMLFNSVAGLHNVPLLASWSQTAITVAGRSDGIAGSDDTYLYWNRGISISSDDTLYIADRVNNRVVFLKLDDTTTRNTFKSAAGTTVSVFNYPADLCVTDTAVYVLDTNNYRVQKYTRNGTDPVTLAGAGLFSSSYNMFIDGDENVYLSLYADNKVIRFAAGSSNWTVVAGDGTLGYSSAQLNGPNGLTVDDVGTVYVADTKNNRVQKWPAGATAGTTVAGTGVSGSNVAQLSSPESVVVDANGYLYIVDRGNNRIVRWGPGATSGLCIVACMSSSGAQSNRLDYPIDLAFDSGGSLYVSDDGNSRVQKFQIINGTAPNTTTALTTPRTTTLRNSVTRASQSSSMRVWQTISLPSSSAAMASIMWATHLLSIAFCYCLVIGI